MMWSAHMLITEKLYRLPHSIPEPSSKELSVGIGCKSSRRYFCIPPANSLGNVIVLGHVLSQPCRGVCPYGDVELCKGTCVLLHARAAQTHKHTRSFPAKEHLRGPGAILRQPSRGFQSEACIYSSPALWSRRAAVVGRILGP